MTDRKTKRRVFILAGVIDMILSGFVLLIYFGFLPVDISSLGIPRWVVGVIGAVWFLSAVGIFAYQLSRTDDISE
jgi:hypothetical protein